MCVCVCVCVCVGFLSASFPTFLSFKFPRREDISLVITEWRVGSA